MKKGIHRGERPKSEVMRAEYDFARGVRGKHYKSLQAGLRPRRGYTITVHKKDGSTVVKEVKPAKGAIVLEPEVRAYFPDSSAVNSTLRSLIRLILVTQNANRK